MDTKEILEHCEWLFSSGGSEEEIIAHLQPLAEEGQADAQLLLGRCYDELLDETEQALQLFEQAAELGNTEALCLLGDYLIEEDDPEGGLEYYQKAIDAGDPDGWYHQAYFFLEGSGIDDPCEVNLELAGHDCDEHGEGGCSHDHSLDSAVLVLEPKKAESQESFDLALSAFLSAAEMGHSNSAFAVGMLHMQGWGLEMNLVEGTYWLEESAKSGGIGAAQILYIIAKNDPEMSENKLLERRQVWRDLWMIELDKVQRQADLDSATAHAQLGGIYATGAHGDFPEDVDIERSRSHYQEAALLGDSDGMFEFGHMLLHGEGGKRDVVAAIDELQRSIETEPLGGSSSICAELLASIYSGNFGEEFFDQEVAVRWADKAVELEQFFIEEQERMLELEA